MRKYSKIFLPMMTVMMFTGCESVYFESDLNELPIVANESKTIQKNNELKFRLEADDKDGDEVFFKLVEEPNNGQVTIDEMGEVVYIPNFNYNGEDVFRYEASDKSELNQDDKYPQAEVKIMVTNINNKPIVEVSEKKIIANGGAGGLDLTSWSSDLDRDVLNYIVVQQTAHGTVTIVNGQVEFNANPGYNGEDQFTYKINDGEGSSREVLVKVFITNNNQRPTTTGALITTTTDIAKTFTLPGNDADGDALTYSIVTTPTNGVVTISGNQATYTPNASYGGSDSFAFKANDGSTDSNTSIIALTIDYIDGTTCDDGDVLTFNEYYTSNICGNGVVDGQVCEDGNIYTKDEFYTSGICGNGVADMPKCPTELIGSTITWKGNYYEVVDNTSIKTIAPNGKYSEICTTQVTDMHYLFYSKRTFNTPISNFDTSNVTNMYGMFNNAEMFNQSVSNFDTSNVVEMFSMFNNARAFNQSVSNFDTSNVTSMYGMFRGAYVFDKDVSGFDTTNVTDMSLMFLSTRMFNQSVSNFDTSNVTNMGGMFGGTYLFDQSVSNFDTSNVTNMSGMFGGTKKFNQSCE